MMNERNERPMWHVEPIIWGQKGEKFAESDRLNTITHCNHRHGRHVSSMDSFFAKIFVIAMWKWLLSR